MALLAAGGGSEPTLEALGRLSKVAARFANVDALVEELFFGAMHPVELGPDDRRQVLRHLEAMVAAGRYATPRNTTQPPRQNLPAHPGR